MAYREDNSAQQDEPRRRRLLRSGWTTAVVITVLLLGFGITWHLHQKARFHELTAPVIPETVAAPMPGGQAAILLSRVALLNDAEPEFVNATVLPGVGMQLLQIGAAAPGQSSHELIAGPSPSDAARMPAAQINAAPFHLRVGTLHLQNKDAGEDILGTLPSTRVESQTLVDGGQATGTFSASSSGVTALVETTLAGRVIDIVVRATNKAADSRFVYLQWAPLFLAPEGDLQKLALSIPAKTSARDSGAANFSAADGAPLPNFALDQNFTNISRDFLGDGTVVRLLNAAGKYQLRITGMGETVRSLHLTTDPGAHTARLTFSSLDPAADPEQRDQVVRPGQTLLWHLRIEIQPIRTVPDIVGESGSHGTGRM